MLKGQSTEHTPERSNRLAADETLATLGLSQLKPDRLFIIRPQ
jgi:hypothetical protein